MFFRRKWITTRYGPSYPKVEAEVRALTNQRHLRKIARKALHPHLREIAADAITSQRFLIRLAQEDPHIDVRLAALRKINDAGKRVPIAVSILRDGDVSDEVCVDVIETVLRDYGQAQEELRAILSCTESDYTAIRAAELLDDEAAAQRVFLRVALDEKSPYCEDAIRHITDEGALLEIVRRHLNDRNAMMAADQIDSEAARQLAYREIALAERCPLMSRYRAVQRVDDPELAKAVCEELLKAANARVWQQSGTHTWRDSDMLRIAGGCKRFLDGGSF